jgi:hypothetical protein
MSDDSEKTKTEPTKDAIEEALRRVDRLPILDDRNAEEILAYDEDGLPR